MVALKPRNRAVIFRLTEDEYRSLQEACARNGGRNLSEFTRSELLNTIGHQSGSTVTPSELNEALSNVQTAIERLTEHVVSATQRTEKDDAKKEH